MVSKGDDLSPIKSYDTFSRGRKRSHDKLKTLNLLLNLQASTLKVRGSRSPYLHFITKSYDKWKIQTKTQAFIL